MNETPFYAYLAARPGSRYRQYFFRGRNLRAETLYRATVGPEAMTPEQVAEDYDVPVEAVREAIRYSVDSAELLRTERERDWSDARSRGLLDVPAAASVGP